MQTPMQHNAAILETHRNKARPLFGHFLWSGNGVRGRQAGKGTKLKGWICDKKGNHTALARIKSRKSAECLSIMSTFLIHTLTEKKTGVYLKRKEYI